MSRYLRSSSQTIVKPVISDRIKAFAQSVGIAAWDQNVLSIQEKAFGGRYRGPHDYSEFYKKKYRKIQHNPVSPLLEKSLLVPKFRVLV